MYLCVRDIDFSSFYDFDIGFLGTVSTVWVRIMVFNATFNNISAISWWSVLLGEET
jgi:hypothetical protein